MTERKPFAAPGMYVTGDGDGEKRAAQARRLLFHTKAVADAAGVPVFRSRQVLQDGTVLRTQVAGPVERVHIHAEEEPEETAFSTVLEGAAARLVWLPEGFVITPRSVLAPDGYGMPDTEDGRGTPGGPLQQVIINRFAGNQYPDELVKQLVNDLADRLDANSTQVEAIIAAVPVVAANLFFMPWEQEQEAHGLGVSIPRIGWTAQFSDPMTPTTALREREGAEDAWVCHRPTASKREDAVTKLMREATNVVRSNNGMEPLGAALRGMEHQASYSVAYQISYTGLLAHDSYDFRDGYWLFEDRIRVREGWSFIAGENLGALSTSRGIGAAQEIIDGWVDSPSHFANMIADWHEGGDYYGFAEHYMTDSQVTLSAYTPPPYQWDTPQIEYDPPFTATVAAQVLGGMPQWVWFAPSQATGRVTGTLYDDWRDMPFSPATITTGATSRPAHWMEYRGRSFVALLPASPYFAFFDTHLFVREGVLWMRALLHRRPFVGGDSYSPSAVVLAEGELIRFEETLVVIAQFDLPARTHALVCPRFSASGQKATFTYGVVEPHDTHICVPTASVNNPSPADRPYGDPLNTDATRRQYLWGETRYVMESVNNGPFVQVDDPHELKIVPTHEIQFEGDTSGTRPFINKSCTGSCVFSASYSGETLVFTTITVNCWTEQEALNTFDLKVFTRRLQGSLTFPNGAGFEYQNSTMTQTGLIGFVRHLSYLDVGNPGDTTYIELNLSGGYVPSAVGTLYSHGIHQRVVGQCMDPDLEIDPTWGILRAGQPGGTFTLGIAIALLLTPTMDFRDGYSGVRDVANGDYSIISLPRLTSPVSNFPHYVPLEPYNAVLSAASRPPPTSLEVGSPTERANIRVFENVGPHFYAPLIGETMRTQTGRYGGKYITAGMVGNPIRHDTNVPAVAPFYQTDLDLRGITGIVDLSNNILPFGVI